MTTRVEFLVDRLSPEGQLLGRNNEVSIPLGTTFTIIRKTKLGDDPLRCWSTDLETEGTVRLKLIRIEWYRRNIPFLSPGHTAGLTVEGEGLEALARALQDAADHEYISLAADVDDEQLKRIQRLYGKDSKYRWGDDDPTSTSRTSSVRRIGKLLLVAIIIVAALAGLFMFGSMYQQGELERQEREKLEREMNETSKAVREGKSGPAFRRLFGVEEPKEQAK